VTSVIGEKVLAIKGDVRDDLGRAPIVSGVHNFKTRRDHIPDDLNDPKLEWGQSNVEWSYTVLARLESSLSSWPVSVLFRHGGLRPRFNDDHIVFYGSEGAIYIKGHYGSGPLFHYGKDKEWRPVELPTDIVAGIPDIEGDTERNWRHLTCKFVEDIRGGNPEPYQTFKEGSFYQHLIDLIRQNDNWVDVTHLQD